MSFSQIKVELLETMGSDRSIADCAWTSSYNQTKKKERTDEDVTRLVQELVVNGHSVPLESVVFRFWIYMPIFTDRQHITHRMASQNASSARFRTMTDDFYGKDSFPPDIQIILAHANLASAMLITYQELCSRANKWYRGALADLKRAEADNIISNIEYKRVREVIRGVLPQSNMTERVTQINLVSFANYQRKRNDPHAQPEIQFVAKEMLRLVKETEICPVAIKALEEIKWRL